MSEPSAPPPPDSPAAAQSPAPPPAKGFFAAVRQALRGESHDYTTLAPERAVLLLAVPMVLEMLMESLFTIVDIFWVGGLGREAVAVVGLTESVMSLIYAVAIGVSFSATAIVSRRIGEKNPALAAQAAGQILVLGAGLSAAIGLVGGWFAGDILRLMGAEPAVVEQGRGYARLMLGGNATVFLIFLINAVFRGAGDALIAMRTLILANSLNIVLDPCFIHGWGPFPAMGVTGAAVATNIGRGVGVAYQLWHLTARAGRVRLRLDDLRPRAESLAVILRTSAHGVGQLLINTTSWVGLFKILALFGSPVVAGYTIAIRVVIFALMPAWGLANAGATLVGQNLGAGRPDRAAAAVRIAARHNVAFLGAAGLVFVVFARPILGVFTTDAEVLGHAVTALRVVGVAMPLYAAGMCYEAAFNGAGDTATPTRLNFFCFWLGQIPLAWLLSGPLGLGPLGVFVSVPLAFSALALWSRALFRGGRWSQKRV